MTRTTVSSKDIEDIVEFRKYSNDIIYLKLENTRGFSKELLEKIIYLPNIFVYVTSGYTKRHNEKFNNRPYTENKNKYNLDDLEMILDIKEDILRGIPPEASDLLKTYILYIKLRKHLYYSENGSDDLLGLLTSEVSSLGSSFILQEFLDNLNIPNRMIFLKDFKAAINAIKVNNYEILLDLGRELYAKGTTPCINYFGTMDLKNYYHLAPPAKEETVKNYNEFTRLTEVEMKKLEETYSKLEKRLSYKIFKRKDGSKFLLSPLSKEKFLYAEVSSIIKNYRLVYSDIDLLNTDPDTFNHLLERDNLFTESNHLTNKSIKTPRYQKYLRDDLQFILEEMEDFQVFRYNYYEIKILEDKTALIKEKEIITDNNLFLFNKEDLVLKYLTKKRITESKFTNGYLGYIK